MGMLMAMTMLEQKHGHKAEKNNEKPVSDNKVEDSAVVADEPAKTPVKRGGRRRTTK